MKKIKPPKQKKPRKIFSKILSKKTGRYIFDVSVCLLAAFIIAIALHSFANYNNFAPGGLNGLAAMASHLSGWNMGYFVLLFNLPPNILYFFFIDKRTASLLTFLVVFQFSFLLLFEYVGFPYYKTDTNLIYAALATGIVSGLGMAFILRRLGASGGTYAISALIKHFRPEKNVAAMSFFMDMTIVGISLFVYGFAVESVLSTLVSLFIANYVGDYVLKGLKNGYKFEIITDHPEELSKELIEKLGRSVTYIKAKGMYTQKERGVLIIIIRKRQIGDFLRFMKNHPDEFAYMSDINEVYGYFKP